MLMTVCELNVALNSCFSEEKCDGWRAEAGRKNRFRIAPVFLSTQLGVPSLGAGLRLGSVGDADAADSAETAADDSDNKNKTKQQAATKRSE
jgi:hypothetical protein